MERMIKVEMNERGGKSQTVDNIEVISFNTKRHCVAINILSSIDRQDSIRFIH